VCFKNTVFHLLGDKPNVYRYNRYGISDINAFTGTTTLRIGNVLVSRLRETWILYILDLARKQMML